MAAQIIFMCLKVFFLFFPTIEKDFLKNYLLSYKTIGWDCSLQTPDLKEDPLSPNSLGRHRRPENSCWSGAVANLGPPWASPAVGTHWEGPHTDTLGGDMKHRGALPCFQIHHRPSWPGGRGISAGAKAHLVCEGGPHLPPASLPLPYVGTRAPSWS